MLLGTEAFEIEILKSIQNIFGCGFMDFIMPFVSFLGDGGLIWVTATIVFLCTKKYRRLGILLSVGLILGVIFGNLILKNLIARPRPCWIEDTFPLLVESPTDFSHPSGHTLSSFIAAFILAKWDRRFGYAAIPVATLIAFSRLYLFVHFPTDILGGIALAYAVYKLVMYVNTKISE